MKKALGFVIIVFMFLPMVAIASGQQDSGSASAATVNPAGTFPIVDEPVTLTFFARKTQNILDLRTNEFTKYYEEKTNVHIEWELVPDNAYQEKKKLALASGDYPDVLFGVAVSPEEQLQYGAEAGILIPLNNLIDKYGLEFKKMSNEVDYIRPAVTSPDGNIYALPQVNECYHCMTSQKLWINRFWLENLGLDMPETTEEFYQTLKAFKENDPNGNGVQDEIALSGATTSWRTNLDGYLMNAFTYNDSQDPNGRLMIDENGTVWAPYVTEEWRDGLRWINKLYNEGLIDPAGFTQIREDLQTLVETPDKDLVGAFTAGWFGVFTSLEGEAMKRWDALPPLKGPDGFQSTGYYPYSFSNGQFAITDVCENPEVAYRWADDLYTLENALMYIEAGRKGIEWDDADPGQLDLEGKPARWQRLETTYKYGEIQNVHYYQMGPSWRSAAYRRSWMAPQDAYSSNGYEKRLFDQSQWYEPFAPSWTLVYPPTFPVGEDVDEVATLKTDVNDYIKESTARFITGDLDIESDWDRYLKNFENLGLTRFIELMQKAYDAQYK
jgi:putative aldouronate transport system substrate-binding protein